MTLTSKRPNQTVQPTPPYVTPPALASLDCQESRHMAPWLTLAFGLPMRTLCLSLDFDAILFWRDGESQDKADERALPLSDGLKQRLDQFYKWFGELYLTAGPGSQLDNRLFDDRGIELWEELRSELEGKYRVTYYSQELAEYFETPELFRMSRKETHA